MKFLIRSLYGIAAAGIFFSLAQPVSAKAKTQTEPDVLRRENTLTVSKKQYRLVIESRPSNSENPQGYCGAGEEITLTVFRGNGKKTIFSKLIASCLKNIELTDWANVSADKFGSLDISTNPITIGWLSYENASPATGSIDLSFGKPVFSVKTAK